ncbi:hypothetical protein GW835_03440 [archaeon]|nr:hypothetical protein [archaeon]NCP79591.1 hypothetical protein [archaeon]NCP98338.1 hypothetical protein [archaeon]NCQ07358.1 hypothetical protein [archaeon]NCQ51154.1 hypothetical protein [archaeon]
MNYKYFFVFLLVVLFSSMVFSYTIGFDYAEVRTTSYPNYLNYQYAHYYDNIDLRYGVYGSGISSPVTIIVSPKVYGITTTGQRVFVHNIQTHSFSMNPSSFYTYSYNPMFSFDPAYQSYEVVLDLQSSDGSFNNSVSRYVYSQGTNPNPGGDDPTGDDPNVVSCDDFYVSGMEDIYLDEDSREYYNLYLVNSVDLPLTITSVTVSPNNPTNLEIEDITYPFTVSALQTRSAQIELFTDTVSSDYSNSFQIEVKGKYDNSLTCEKTYNVNYRILDAELENNGSCSDIRILDDYFTMSDNSSKTFEIEVSNASQDYYFEVDDIDLDTTNDSIIEASVRNTIDKIYTDSSKILKINVSSDDTSFYRTEKIDLELTGYLKRENREDKKCRIREDVSIRVSPDSSTGNTSNECDDIKIYTRDVFQDSQITENYSLQEGFYIYNGTNKKFTVSGINYKDNTMYADIFSKSFDYTLYPRSSNALNFDIRTSEVSENKLSNAEISIQGYFEGGLSCSYSDITSNFNLTIREENDFCSNVGIYDDSFVEGENYFTVYNNTNKDFTVNDIISQNSVNSNVGVIDSSFKVLKDSQKTFRVGSSGNGSFELLAKGVFSDGTSCDYTQTSSGYFNSDSGYDFSDTSCEFEFNYPNVKYISLNGDSLNFDFRNLTGKSGEIRLSAVGAVIEDPIIKFSSYSSFNKEIDLLNIKNPKMVLYTIEIYGCSKKSYFTNLYPLGNSIQGDVSFLTYPSNLISTKDKFISSFSLKNSSSFSEDVEIKFSGFTSAFNFVSSPYPLNPNTFSSSDNVSTVTINPNSTKNIYFGVDVLENAEYKKYNGYIEVYSNNKLLFKEPLSIDRSITTNNLLVNTMVEKTSVKNTVLLTFTFENKLPDLTRELYLSFEDENSFEVDGNRNISVAPLSVLERSFTVKYNEGSLFKYNLIDTDNSSLAYSGEVDLKEIDNSSNLLSGFFTLSDTKGFIFAIVLILLIALIIFLIVYGDKSRAKRKQETKSVLETQEKIKEEIRKDNFSNITKSEIIIGNKPIIKPAEPRQITLGELD